MRGLFGRILGIFKPVRRNDPVFGSMLYMGRYWEGKARFPPSDSEIEVFVRENREDSFERQHRFFEKVVREWPQLREVLAPKLRELYLQANAKPLLVPPWEDFVIGSISIPDSSFETAEWTIGLDAKSDDGHTYFVEMRASVPVITSWDS